MRRLIEISNTTYDFKARETRAMKISKDEITVASSMLLFLIVNTT